MSASVEKRINVLIAVTAALTLVFGGLAYLFRDAAHDSAQTGDVTVPVCEYIDVEILRLNVEITPFDGDNIRVAYKNEVPLDVELGDNRLTIKESEEFVISLFAGSEAEFGLWIYLPREVYRDITVYTGGGSVRADGIECGKLTVVTDSGDITVKNSVSPVSLASTSGDIYLDCAEVIPDSSVTTLTGGAEIVIPKDASVSLEFETDSGECVTDLFKGSVYGSYTYSFNGGKRRMSATVGEGTLVISERQED